MGRKVLYLPWISSFVKVKFIQYSSKTHSIIYETDCRWSGQISLMKWENLFFIFNRIEFILYMSTFYHILKFLFLISVCIHYDHSLPYHLKNLRGKLLWTDENDAGSSSFWGQNHRPFSITVGKCDIKFSLFLSSNTSLLLFENKIISPWDLCQLTINGTSSNFENNENFSQFQSLNKKNLKFWVVHWTNSLFQH